MAEPDSLQDLASALGNASATGDAFHMSRTTFQIIIDQLQRLNRNGDDHDQVIHELRSEISSLKPQVQGLQAENASLKREIEILRVQQQDTLSCAPSAKVAVPGVNTRSMSTSSSLSYVSQNPGSSPDIRRRAQDSPSNDEAVNNAQEIQKGRVSRRTRQNASSSESKVAEIPFSEEDSAESLSPRRAGLRKRKAPAQPDADWQPPQSHPAKRLRPARETAEGSDAPHSPFKGEPALLNSKQSHVPVEQKMDFEIRASLPLIAKFPIKEIKSDCLMMPHDLADRLLANVPTLKVHPPPLSLEIPITMLGTEYQAATQTLLWHNTNKKGIHPSDVRRFIYPGFDTNPEMTSKPGEPGLLLCGRTELLQGTWSLFTRVVLKNSTLKRWNYAGEYKSEVVGTLSAQDFTALSNRVKQTWGKKIAFHKKHLPYTKMRARISLKKVGEPVKEANLKKELEVIKNTPKAQSQLSIQDVIDAFESGEEAIPIVRMECVSYNRVFAEELLAKSKALTASTKASKSSD